METKHEIPLFQSEGEQSIEIEMEVSATRPFCRGTGKSVTCTSHWLYESRPRKRWIIQRTKIRTKIQTEIRTEIQTKIQTEIRTEIWTKILTGIQTKIQTKIRTEIWTKILTGIWTLLFSLSPLFFYPPPLFKVFFLNKKM